MILVGLLDSPYVRRVAISLQLLGLPFEHRALSVFRHMEEFKKYNPVIKAPTLVCDDGEVLLDSSLILDYAELLAGPGKSLMPAGLRERRHALRLIGLALALCEKSVQVVYEQALRPADKLHQPWLERVSAQMNAAAAAIEAELQRSPFDGNPGQAAISCAVAWCFAQDMTPAALDSAACPLLAAHSRTMEQLPAFRAAPHGVTTMSAETGTTPHGATTTGAAV